jgi:hypothetical protein
MFSLMADESAACRRSSSSYFSRGQTAAGFPENTRLAKASIWQREIFIRTSFGVMEYWSNGFLIPHSLLR